MRAQTVNFERGGDPKKSMHIGLGPKKALMELKKISQEIGFSNFGITQITH